MRTAGIISMGIIGSIITLLIYGGLIGGGIYFTLWCLKHFGIIGG